MNSKYLSIIGLVILAGLAYATYTMTSNHITGPVEPTLALIMNGSSVNGTSIIEGAQVNLTAICSDTTFAGNVTFYNATTSIGSQNATAGIATLLYIIPHSTAYDFSAEAPHE